MFSFTRFQQCTCKAAALVAATLLVLSPPSLANLSARDTAERIKTTYESKLSSLSLFKQGHYSLRLYRLTQDAKYIDGIQSDLERIANKLNFFATSVYTAEEIQLYSTKRLLEYVGSYDERSQRRYHATQRHPEYLYLGVDLLGALARADEYGLKHQDDQRFRYVLQQYDFSVYVTSREMIKAWAAQLANQVYWLKQLGEADYTDLFKQQFRDTYPDSQDESLSNQQFMNKVYGMTHIILADSRYYQSQVREQEHQWIYTYFRRNQNKILAQTKEDVIAEVGICFLLAGLYDDPFVAAAKEAIRTSVNLEHGMIPSTSGSFDFASGEHRNVLAVMLLDWKTPRVGPRIENEPEVFYHLPEGLVPKK
ncbi:DUF3541 domain-containing protein [Vibrio sp. WXL210]|uniref:DUF3541 domain-containing protein n=1 Tax=Vibrio sp. WXL210 TaxID=3450709 RepID=UPI003EC6C6FB